MTILLCPGYKGGPEKREDLTVPYAWRGDAVNNTKSYNLQLHQEVMA